MKNVNTKYRELEAALFANNARPMWQIGSKELERMGFNFQTLECWALVDGRLIIVQQWKNNEGYDYYIQTKEHDVSSCMKELALCGQERRAS